MSKIISAEQLKACLQAAAPVVIGATGGGAPALRAEVAEQLKDLEKKAYDAGYGKGRDAGYAAGLKEVQTAAAPLLAALRQPLDKLDEEVERELIELALAIARQIVRREIRQDPGQVVAVVREAIAALPVAMPRIVIRLHPGDVALVREAMALAEDSEALRIVEDPSMTRGSCRVVTDTSQVDATIETRIAGIAARLLGGERSSDAADD